jgi:hypothetical protein
MKWSMRLLLSGIMLMLLFIWNHARKPMGLAPMKNVSAGRTYAADDTRAGIGYRVSGLKNLKSKSLHFRFSVLGFRWFPIPDSRSPMLVIFRIDAKDRNNGVRIVYNPRR